MAPPPPMTGPRYNEFIQSQKVRVIDENGENLGVMYTREAFEQAQTVGLDLVEISPNADPPVAKFLDIGRHKYEAQKKAAEQRKKQKTQEIKEIKMRPNIDDHDYDTKMKKVFEFLEEGDKVKVTMRFRGREMAHGELGMAVLRRVQEQTAERGQGRGASAHGRPPDADGARAQISVRVDSTDQSLLTFLLPNCCSARHCCVASHARLLPLRADSGLASLPTGRVAPDGERRHDAQVRVAAFGSDGCGSQRRRLRRQPQPTTDTDKPDDATPTEGATASRRGRQPGARAAAGRHRRHHHHRDSP